MILKGVDTYSRQNEESSSESDDESKNKGEDDYPCNGDILMIRRTLHNQPSPQP